VTSTNKPRIEAYIGASGSGKGVSMDRRFAELKAPRLLMFDPRDQFPRDVQRTSSLADLVAIVKRAGAKGAFRVRFVPGGAVDLKEAFALVCELAFVAGNLVFAVDELSEVTTPSWAPAPWRRCVTQGRLVGLHIIAAAQRPALIDKTLLGNCTFIRCFTLRFPNDRRVMADVLDVPLDQVRKLETIESAKATTIAFIERDFRTGERRTDAIKLRARA
jgi:hypothetical protein